MYERFVGLNFTSTSIIIIIVSIIVIIIMIFIIGITGIIIIIIIFITFPRSFLADMQKCRAVMDSVA